MTLIKDKAYQEQLRFLYCFCKSFRSAFATGGKGGEVHSNEVKIYPVCELCRKPHNSLSPYMQKCNDCDCWYWGGPETLACGKGYNNCIQAYIERGLA